MVLNEEKGVSRAFVKEMLEPWRLCLDYFWIANMSSQRLCSSKCLESHLVAVFCHSVVLWECLLGLLALSHV